MFFLNRQRKVHDVLIIVDPDGNTRFHGTVQDFILPEESTIRLSMEFFNDPSPCEIHRGAVRERAFQEILSLCPLNQLRSLSELPERIRSFLSDFSGECWIKYVKETHP